MTKSSLRDGTEWWPEGYKGYITHSYTLNYLKEQGYKLQEDKSWTRPQPPRIPTEPELAAIRHLMEEWNYNGIEPYSIGDHCKIVYKINDIEKIEKIIGIKKKE